MKLYEIDQYLEQLLEGSVNELTGEVEVNFDEIEELAMEREKKIENLLLYAKNLDALATAIGEEKKALTARAEGIKKKAENLTRFLQEYLQGQKFQTPKVAVSYRNSDSVVIDDSFIDYAKKYHPELLREKHEWEPDKAEIKRVIKAGHDVAYCRIQHKLTMNIK